MPRSSPDSKVGLKNDFAQGEPHTRLPLKKCNCGLGVVNILSTICDDCEMERAKAKRGKTKR